MSVLRISGLVAMLLWLTASIAHAEKRVALVIGNGAYKHTTELVNPVNDAKLISAKLRGMGYDVVEGLDLTIDQFRMKLHEFSSKVSTADASVLFYAGHGLQVAGQNYLVPIDADIKITADLRWRTVKMQDILAEMESGNRTSVILLDACRDNPLSRKLKRAMKTRSTSVGRGLAQIKAGSGTYIGFATAPGDVASDGDGKNSPFTTALAKYIDKERIDVSAMMRRVRSAVWKETSKQQTPWSNSSLRTDFYMNPKKPEKKKKPMAFAKPAPNPQPKLAAKKPTRTATNRPSVKEAMTLTQSIGTCDAYAAFADEYKGTFYARLAAAWQKKNCGEKAVVALAKPKSDSLPAKEIETPAVLDIAPPSDLDQPQDQAGNTVVATLPDEITVPGLPEDEVEVPEIQTNVDPRDLARSVQRELKRVGCYRGRVDGDWGRGSRAALLKFNNRSSTEHDVQQPSQEMLNRLKIVSGRVCERQQKKSVSQTPKQPMRSKPEKKSTRKPSVRTTAKVSKKSKIQSKRKNCISFQGCVAKCEASGNTYHCGYNCASGYLSNSVCK